MVELQRRLWLYRPVLERQIPLQLSQVNVAPGSEGGECALCSLHSLLSSLCFSYNSLRSRSIHYGLQPLPPSLLPSCLVCRHSCIVGRAILQVCYHSKRGGLCSVRGSASRRWLNVKCSLDIISGITCSISIPPFFFAECIDVHGGVLDGVTDVIPPPFSAADGAVFEGILVGVGDGHTQVRDCCFLFLEVKIKVCQEKHHLLISSGHLLFSQNSLVHHIT